MILCSLVIGCQSPHSLGYTACGDLVVGPYYARPKVSSLIIHGTHPAAARKRHELTGPDEMAVAAWAGQGFGFVEPTSAVVPDPVVPEVQQCTAETEADWSAFFTGAALAIGRWMGIVP